LKEQQGLVASGSSSPLSCFKQLTALQLDSVSVPSLLTLTALTWLRQLGLLDVTCEDSVLDSATGQSHGSLCLQPLTRLTSVCLEPLSMFPAGAMSVFSSLQRLQQLAVTQPACDWLNEQQLMKLAYLPASLTMLKLQLLQEGLHISSSTVPGLQELTAMQKLDMRVQVQSGLYGIHPDFLDRLQQLRALALHGLCSNALKHLAAAMPRLQFLQRVQLHAGDGNSDTCGMRPLLDQQQYSALLPLSQGLQEYSIRYLGQEPPCLYYLFKGFGQWPNLKQLQIEPSQNSTLHMHIPGTKQIALCCPSLQVLLLPSAHLWVMGMQQLTSLTRLTIGRLASWEDTCLHASEIVTLAGLQHLHVCRAMPESTLVALTALTNLTALRVSVSQGSQRPPVEHCFSSEGVRQRLSCCQLHAVGMHTELFGCQVPRQCQLHLGRQNFSSSWGQNVCYELLCCCIPCISYHRITACC
jgi:hypothetical protein